MTQSVDVQNNVSVLVGNAVSVTGEGGAGDPVVIEGKVGAAPVQVTIAPNQKIDQGFNNGNDYYAWPVRPPADTNWQGDQVYFNTRHLNEDSLGNPRSIAFSENLTAATPLDWNNGDFPYFDHKYYVHDHPIILFVTMPTHTGAYTLKVSIGLEPLHAQGYYAKEYTFTGGTVEKKFSQVLNDLVYEDDSGPSADIVSEWDVFSRVGRFELESSVTKNGFIIGLQAPGGLVSP